jgi:hypothetical protein
LHVTSLKWAGLSKLYSQTWSRFLVILLLKMTSLELWGLCSVGWVSIAAAASSSLRLRRRNLAKELGRIFYSAKHNLSLAVEFSRHRVTHVPLVFFLTVAECQRLRLPFDKDNFLGFVKTNLEDRKCTVKFSLTRKKFKIFSRKRPQLKNIWKLFSPWLKSILRNIWRIPSVKDEVK